MFSFLRTMEILLFALCNFGPYVVLSFYAFRKYQRFPRWVTIVGCLIIFSIQFATRYWSALHGINTSLRMSILRLVIYMLGYAVLIDQRFGKIVFVELIFTNLGNFILIAAVCLERNVFPNISHHLYCWHSSVVMFFLHLIITVPWILEAKKYFSSMLDNRRIKKEWNYYWIVPMIFYIIWQYQINGNAKTGLENIENPHNVVFLFIINFGALLIYYLLIRLDGELLKNLEFEEQQHFRDVETLEYQLLTERMEETRRMRHDLRHHVHTVSYYLDTKEYDKLKNYISQYRDNIPSGENIHFCKHPAVNNIVFYFATQAKQNEIDFDAQLSISPDMPMNEHDISVLLGNLLENALDACIEQKGAERRIVIRGKGDLHSLVFTIDNTLENEIKKNQRGEFLTTKKAGSGIGISSARKIVERHDGIFSVEQKGDMFCVSLLLKL